MHHSPIIDNQQLSGLKQKFQLGGVSTWNLWCCILGFQAVALILQITRENGNITPIGPLAMMLEVVLGRGH